MLFPKNIGERLSIDEVNISNGDLYTVLTNKSAKGRKGAIVTMVEGVKATNIADILIKIPQNERELVKEVTLDMSNSMDLIVRLAFPNAKIITDRFHVQQLVSEAVQEIRIKVRKVAIKEETEAHKKAKEEGEIYCPVVYENGDTQKQLLARSRHLLFKSSGNWSKQQKERAEILFREFPELKKAYELSMMFRNCYELSTSPEEAKKKIDNWYIKIEEKKIESFYTPMETVKLHEDTILNYFLNRSTNASAESFNAKLKGFRVLVRGVRDKSFFLFRVAKLYA